MLQQLISNFFNRERVIIADEIFTIARLFRIGFPHRSSISNRFDRWQHQQHIENSTTSDRTKEEDEKGKRRRRRRIKSAKRRVQSKISPHTQTTGDGRYDGRMIFLLQQRRSARYFHPTGGVNSTRGPIDKGQ